MTPQECSPRDLARRVDELAREHPCFSQVTEIIDVACGYMCALAALARLQEINQDAARAQQTMTFLYKNYWEKSLCAGSAHWGHPGGERQSGILSRNGL